MNKKLTITKTDLLKVLTELSKRIEGDNFVSFDLTEDYYWQVIPPDSYKMENDPPLAVGSLYDDWRELLKVIDNKQPLTTVDFERIAAILTYVSEEMVK